MPCLVPRFNLRTIAITATVTMRVTTRAVTTMATIIALSLLELDDPDPFWQEL